mgnify:CR=1 FL=1
MNKNHILFEDLVKIKGVGAKTSAILSKKGIKTVSDLIFKPPYSFTDRTKIVKVKNLTIGKISTLNVFVKKYNFPRIKNLPNKVICHDETGEIDCIFFNSFEGYIKKILPLNQNVTISGKIGYFRNKYQMSNPTYVSNNPDDIKKIFNKYSLTEGISEKKYNSIIQNLLKNLPNLKEWHSNEVLKNFNNISWRDSILKLHNPNSENQIEKNFFRRLAFDEIMANLLFFSEIRTKIKRHKKDKKKIVNDHHHILNKVGFKLTNDQIKVSKEINKDLSSNSKMFRLLQGDVGSGKTIVALLTAYNVVKSGYQVAFMAPTEILSKQHYRLCKELFPKDVNIFEINSKMKISEKNKILDKLKKNEINIIFGTHSLFQKKVNFYNLGYIIIDEQQKFGVKQRKSLSDKGGNNCDVLLMSATPIPRTMTMTMYGDMDVSIIKNKPNNRKDIKTFSKKQENINDVIKFIKKEVNNGNQIFWVCPIIEESKKIERQSVTEKFNYLKNIFPNNINILHGNVDVNEKENILNNFKSKEFSILLSTTIIEVGIDFPNANIIIIEDADKFGLSQLHQLRGRVGRGVKEGICILMFGPSLSQNAKKRLNVLKKTNNGFLVAEEDLKIRGYGDLLGFKQSGIKNFKFADPVTQDDLFLLASREVKKIEEKNINFNRYKILMKIFDQADIINDFV